MPTGDPAGYSKPMKKSGAYEDGTVSTNTGYSTPHQKSMTGSIGVEKAMGMKKVGNIGMQVKKKKKAK